jgi:hypothetical protein
MCEHITADLKINGNKKFWRDFMISFFFRMLPSMYRPRIININKVFLFIMSTYNIDFYNLLVVDHTSIPVFVILKIKNA